jgi:hypothetical protein
VREAVARYRDGFLREGSPIQAPLPIEAGGRAGSEALFLLGNMLRQAQDAKVLAPMLCKAWEKRFDAGSDVGLVRLDEDLAAVDDEEQKA